jgi:hypothetical protein
MNKKSNNLKNISYWLALAVLVAGFFIGYCANNLMQAKQASAQQMEQAKGEIASLYKDDTVDACWRVNEGGNLAAGKYELTYRNLRIKKQADLAIISDCSERDTLLFKSKSGQWTQTTVNLQIGNRVNPVWQKECGIEDITIADDQVRPENSSIDDMNLAECKQIKQQ